LDFFATNSDYVLSVKEAPDLSATYDGQWIVSDNFKSFVESKGYGGISFASFRFDQKHFHVVLGRIVPFDGERRRTKFGRLCPRCGNYDDVIGAKPAYLRTVKYLEDGFYRTDLLFGSGDEKHPLMIVGPNTKHELEESSLVGLEFAPAYGLASDP
jgi:hypothetical protein